MTIRLQSVFVLLTPYTRQTVRNSQLTTELRSKCYVVLTKVAIKYTINTVCIKLNTRHGKIETSKALSKGAKISRVEFMRLTNTHVKIELKDDIIIF